MKCTFGGKKRAIALTTCALLPTLRLQRTDGEITIQHLGEEDQKYELREPDFDAFANLGNEQRNQQGITDHEARTKLQ